MTAPQDIVDLLKRDHDQVRARLNLLDAVSLSRLVSYFDQLSDELARHEVAEETVVYPAFLGSVPHGAEIADECIAEQSDTEAALDRLDAGSPELHDLRAELRTLRVAILAHAAHEEADVFPGLEAYVDEHERRALAVAYEDARQSPPGRRSASGSAAHPGHVVRGRFDTGRGGAHRPTRTGA
jgi:hemerythrin superfamily protein